MQPRPRTRALRSVTPFRPGPGGHGPAYLSPRQMIKGTGPKDFTESTDSVLLTKSPGFEPPIKVWRGAVAIRRPAGMIGGLRRQ